jgi:hypothetical protein
MTANDDKSGDATTRRKVLECMTWAGTGLLWTVSGGVPRSLGLVDQARAEEAKGLTFMQISDSHMGFDKHAGGGDRPLQGAADETVIHDPYRRYYASLQACGIR